jgi:hypothetical protein
MNDLVLFIVDFRVFFSVHFDAIFQSDATLFTSLFDDREALVVSKRLNVFA